jgi:hypothetical protein
LRLCLGQLCATAPISVRAVPLLDEFPLCSLHSMRVVVPDQWVARSVFVHIREPGAASERTSAAGLKW